MSDINRVWDGGWVNLGVVRIGLGWLWGCLGFRVA